MQKSEVNMVYMLLLLLLLFMFILFLLFHFPERRSQHVVHCRRTGK